MKDAIIGAIIAGVGGVIAWFLIQRLSPRVNVTPSDTRDVSAGDAGQGQEYAPAPAGQFVDPNTGRLTQGASRNAATFIGNGGTVASERWPAGHRYA